MTDQKLGSIVFGPPHKGPPLRSEVLGKPHECRPDMAWFVPERLAAQQLYEALKDVEFSYYDEPKGRCCPTCFDYEREEGRFIKHKPDCTLAAALAEYERVAKPQP